MNSSSPSSGVQKQRYDVVIFFLNHLTSSGYAHSMSHLIPASMPWVRSTSMKARIASNQTSLGEPKPFCCMYDSKCSRSSEPDQNMCGSELLGHCHLAVSGHIDCLLSSKVGRPRPMGDMPFPHRVSQIADHPDCLCPYGSRDGGIDSSLSSGGLPRLNNDCQRPRSPQVDVISVPLFNLSTQYVTFRTA